MREVEEAVREELEQRIAQTNDGIEDCAERVARAFAAMLNWALADPTKARTLLRMTPHFADPNAPSNSGVRGDVHAGVAAGRFTGIADEAGIVLVLSVLTGGVNRALDLVQKKKVRVLGESLAQALLVALGLPAGTPRRSPAAPWRLSVRALSGEVDTGSTPESAPKRKSTAGL